MLQQIALRELAALSTIPAAWAIREPPKIVAGLADVLVGALGLDFAFVRMHDPQGGAPIEVTRGHASKTFPEWLRTHLGDVSRFSRKEIVTDLGSAEPCRGVVIPIGVNSERGLVAAACSRSDFPNKIDHLLLGVAANHAATAFQNARLRAELDAKVAELHQARNELEIKVVERTAELTRANEELHRQKEQLDRLFDLSPVGVILTNQNFQVLRVSQEFTRMFGYWPEEALGQSLYGMVVPEEFQEDTLKNMAVVRSGERLNLESVCRRKDGSRLDVSITVAPLSLGSGETAIYLIYRDITEQKDAKRKLERSERELRDVVNTVPAHVWRATPEGQVDFINDRWLQFTGLALENALGWKWEAVVHPDDRTRIAADWRTAIRNGQAMETEARVRRVDGKYCWWFIRNVPLRDETGKLVRWYGTAIDIEDRKQAEQALRKSEERWRSVFENSAIGVALTDLNGRFLATNHVYQTMLGYTEEELRALSFLDITHEDYREANWMLVTELLEEKRRQFQMEKKYLRKDGSSIWVRNNISLVPGSESVPRFIMALSEDITERKRAEEALRRSEAYLAEGQRLAKTGSWARDAAAYKVMYWSEETFRILGLDPQQGIPDCEYTLEIMHPEDRDRVNELRKKAIREKVDFATDYRIVLPDGTLKHLHVIGHPVFDENGDLHEYVGSVMDITERKRAEEALRRSEAYLAEGQRLAKTGSWAYNPNTERPIYWSEEMRRIFGLDPQESNLPNTEEFFRLVHPDERDRFRERIRKAIREKADLAADYRIVLPDGTVKHIHGIGHPVLDETGNIVEYVGTDVDVTEQHEASAALQNAFEQIKAEQAELRRMIDAVATYIYVLGPDGTALYANQTVLDYTGLTLEDLRREDHHAPVFHPEDVERLREERAAALARGEPFELEQRALGKDGKYRWFLGRYNPVRDDQGNIIRWYATGTDIDDRKRAEERMRDENIALREQIDRAFMFEEIVGSSPALQNLLSSVLKVAPTDSTVLITGETGTGKELIARAIHKHSQRSGQAFISVNCASIPPSLIASELFGHEKGAFTGAVQRHQGRFELAHSGTIFLDEVGDLPAEAQVSLLRVLQERQFERVGGNRVLTTDVRVIAATNRDLTAAIAAGTFRSDLFYRLNVFPIEVPPLRQRKEDIPMLVEYFIDRYARKAGKCIRGVNKKTLELFHSYPWPGNIRELQNIIERSVIVCEAENFSVDERWLTRQSIAIEPKSHLDLSEKLALQEKEMIEAALRDCGGQVSGLSGAAARLGMPRSTLESKIHSLKINKNRFKSADHVRKA